MTKEKLLRSREVADQFSVDINTIARWIREKKLVPTLRTMGGHARFSQESIDALKRTTAVPVNFDAAIHESCVDNPPGLEVIIEEFKDVAWRPASKSPMARREAPSETRRLEFKAHVDRLNDGDIKSLFGIDRKELHGRIWSTSVNDVALTYNVSPNSLRRFCDAYRVPIPPLPRVRAKR